MPNSLAHEDWLFKNQKNGFVHTSSESKELKEAVAANLIQHAYRKGEFTYYKLTRAGWEVIRKSRKSLGYS